MFNLWVKNLDTDNGRNEHAQNIGKEVWKKKKNLLKKGNAGE